MAPVSALIVLVGSITVTAYRPVPEQTDDSPRITSIGHQVHPYGTAVSQDLIASGEVCYGDGVIVDGFGLRVVNDTMNARIKRGVDLFVETKAQEQRVGVRRGQTITVIKSPKRACTQKEAMSTMAMVNAKKLQRFVVNFKLANGREPTHEEVRQHMSGTGVRVRALRDVAGQGGALNPGAGSYDVHSSDGRPGAGAAH